MAAPINKAVFLSRVRVLPLVRMASSVSGSGQTTSKPPPPPSSASKPPRGSKDAGQTDSSKYNSPEYYQHNIYSYYDIDAQAQKYRIVQPSKFDPLKPKK